MSAWNRESARAVRLDSPKSRAPVCKVSKKPETEAARKKSLFSIGALHIVYPAARGEFCRSLHADCPCLRWYRPPLSSKVMGCGISPPQPPAFPRNRTRCNLLVVDEPQGAGEEYYTTRRPPQTALVCPLCSVFQRVHPANAKLASRM